MMPWALILALTSFIVACGLAIGGVYTLFGTGWAMLFSAIPFVFLSWVIKRGL